MELSFHTEIAEAAIRMVDDLLAERSVARVAIITDAARAGAWLDIVPPHFRGRAEITTPDQAGTITWPGGYAVIVDDFGVKRTTAFTAAANELVAAATFVLACSAPPISEAQRAERVRPAGDMTGVEIYTIPTGGTIEAYGQTLLERKEAFLARYAG